MSVENQEPTPETANPHIEYLDNEIAGRINDIESAGPLSVGTIILGAYCSIQAITNSIGNGNMRAGEITLATLSVASLYLGSVSLGDYRRSHRELFELKKLKAEALKD